MAGYPVNIPVYIRGRVPPSSQIPSISQQVGTQSGASGTMSAAGGPGEEYTATQSKRLPRGRLPSSSQSGNLTGSENDNRSFSLPGKRNTDYSNF